ncbi:MULTISPECIES: ABC transporter ATP-binding protein [Glutamicibacter]|uniref:ABC transporter ATP-binding protein n=1 Tax=Glutamicibacter TaxID=1742989 RepID=UPI0011F244A4|nr:MULTISPECIES: ABC transporter ATP-binding protein [Glutamicibacter]MDV2976235.1 ABC transporter ATP-binding protein [Actinomycetes bacterium ARC8]QEP07446.1 ABC transporter ATP-binding protein [Glutamicibacter sp. ZJUTW]
MSSVSPSLVINELAKDLGPVPALDNRMLRVLESVSLKAFPGQVTTLLGANGAGKSTTLACAQGLLQPEGGTVELLGQNPFGDNPELRSRVGVMLQDGGLPPSMRPIPLLRHVASLYQKPIDIDALITRLDLESFGTRTIRRLSGGQKQRVALAVALAGDPEVLFLDEPSAGLDPQSRQVVFDLIAELRDAGKAIILTTHLMDDAQRLSDYVYIIDKGCTVAQGTVAELTARAAEDPDTRPVSFSAPAGLRLPEPPAGLRLEETASGQYRLDGVNSPEHLNWLTQWWLKESILPIELNLQSRSLEDVFLEIAIKEEKA